LTAATAGVLTAAVAAWRLRARRIAETAAIGVLVGLGVYLWQSSANPPPPSSPSPSTSSPSEPVKPSPLRSPALAAVAAPVGHGSRSPLPHAFGASTR